jgi:hypothetical protein
MAWERDSPMKPRRWHELTRRRKPVHAIPLGPGQTAETVGQSIHELTTDIRHKRAVLMGQQDECMVIGEIIANRLAALAEA